MILYFRKALLDIGNNGFLNAATTLTIAFSILIVSAFALFFANANDVVTHWEKGITVMAYLKPGTTADKRLETKYAIKQIQGVTEAIFISRDEALAQLKKQMKKQASILEGLEQNPLPDAFQIRMAPSDRSLDQVEAVAVALGHVPSVESIEYGQRWIGRFIYILEFFRLAGYGVGALFLLGALFFVANTSRLVIYARREEIEIMRLVGAEEKFIRTPLYIGGFLQGAFGGITGLGVLYVCYRAISSSVEESFAAASFQIRFLAPEITGVIMMGSMFVGWLGCFLALKQFLKR
jgi:cell division transport system permease protein